MDESIHDQEARRRYWEQRESVPVSQTQGNPERAFELHVRDEQIAALRSELDAALAERDALKASLALEREQVALGGAARDALHDEVQAYMKEKRAIEDALRAELAEVRAKAKKVHDELRGFNESAMYGDAKCLLCGTWTPRSDNPVERHAPDCEAAPDYLTQTAKEEA